MVGLDIGARDPHAARQPNEASDPFYPSFGTPEVLKTLLEMGRGPEDQGRFYKKVGRDVLRFDLVSKGLCPERREG